MSVPSSNIVAPLNVMSFMTWGMFWLLVSVVTAGLYFSNGIDALLVAWQLPEYSHGPLIPVLSALLFLRELRDQPVEPGPKSDRWPGVLLIAVALLFGALGILADIEDVVAYGLILWIGGLLLTSFGWRTGRNFWPSVLHLVYMLPLPSIVYYKVSTHLQFLSSEIGVWFLKLLSVPVFLDGNIIDLGVTKLHVAEACSGLRYMFPILSFSYIFAVLYRGPAWQKAVLLISAVPIAILMNSIRIAVAGIIVQYYGLDWLEGFTHFFEGWVIFLACIAILFLLAWLMLFLHPDKPSLPEALDLELSDILPQAKRVQYVQASKALITATCMALAATVAILSIPEREVRIPARETFTTFPRQLGAWEQAGPREYLSADVARVLAADDYHQVNLTKAGEAFPVGLFMAWYDDQSNGGVHSPEICLPGSGWEIAWLERTDVTETLGTNTPFGLNRAIIQKGEIRMMVYYWFQQKDRRLAWDFAARFWLKFDSITTGRTDGAMVRLTTPIGHDEDDATAEARLMSALKALQEPLPRFIPDA